MGFGITLIHIALSSLAVLFSMWWLYFSREDHLDKQDLPRALTWGYGHLFIFMAGAAVGAGFALLVDIVTGHSQTSLLIGEYAVAVPLAVYFLGLWLVRDRVALQGMGQALLPIGAAIALAAPLALGLEGVAAVAVLVACTRNGLACRFLAGQG